MVLLSTSTTVTDWLTKARFPFKRNRLRCVRKRKPQEMQALALVSSQSWLPLLRQSIPIGWLALAFAFLAFFVYATHTTQAIVFEWKPGLTERWTDPVVWHLWSECRQLAKIVCRVVDNCVCRRLNVMSTTFIHIAQVTQVTDDNKTLYYLPFPTAMDHATKRLSLNVWQLLTSNFLRLDDAFPDWCSTNSVALKHYRNLTEKKNSIKNCDANNILPDNNDSWQNGNVGEGYPPFKQPLW